MGRLIALAIVSFAVWKLWQRWQRSLNGPPSAQAPKSSPQKLSQCQRCDAMLPSAQNERQEVARSCEHGDRCPLQQER